MIVNSILIFILSLKCLGVLCTSHKVKRNDSYSVKELCKDFLGEHVRVYELGVVCCGNETLRLPKEYNYNENATKSIYRQCSKEFKNDGASNLPTAMWKSILCELKKMSVFKSSKLSFQEVFEFMTKNYPAKTKSQIKTRTTKCSAIDSETITDDMKVEKYMTCFDTAENKVCHKPYGGGVVSKNHDKEIKEIKQYGCPVISPPDLSLEYCCKKRTTPYPVLDFPGHLQELSEDGDEKVGQCEESFAVRQEQLMPASVTTQKPTNKGNKDDDDDDVNQPLGWDALCYVACLVNRQNYSQSMLKLDYDKTIQMLTEDYGKSVKDELQKILKHRKNTQKIFLAMDGPNSKPMNFQEISAKFLKATEKEKIPYFCKFMETIHFEERRAVQQYCINEKYAKKWGEDHHSLYVSN